jgi:hypothetical protein
MQYIAFHTGELLPSIIISLSNPRLCGSASDSRLLKYDKKQKTIKWLKYSTQRLKSEEGSENLPVHTNERLSAFVV